MSDKNSQNESDKSVKSQNGDGEQNFAINQSVIDLDFHNDDNFERIQTTVSQLPKDDMKNEFANSLLIPPVKEKQLKQKVIEQVSVNKRMTDDDRRIEFKFSQTEEFSPCVKLQFKAEGNISLLLSDDVIILYDKKDEKNKNLKIISTQGQKLESADSKTYSMEQKMQQYLADTVILQKPWKEILNDQENSEVELLQIICSHNKKEILLCTSDGQVIIVQSHDFKEISRIAYENKSEITDIAVTEKLLAVAYGDNCVIVYEKNEEENQYTIMDKKEEFQRKVIGVQLCSESQEELVVILENNKDYKESNEQEVKQKDKEERQEQKEIPNGKDNLVFILISASKLKRIGSTFLYIDKKEVQNIKKFFQVTADYLIVRTENRRSFEIISTDKFEAFSKGPDKITEKPIRLLQLLPDNKTIMVHDEENVFLYDFQGAEISGTSSLSDKAACYLITSSKINGKKTEGFQVISLPDKITLFVQNEKNIEKFSIQPQIFTQHQNCLFFPEKDCSYFIETSENKPKFKNVQFVTQNQKYIIVCDREAKITSFIDVETRFIKKEFQNMIPLTCSSDSNLVYCSDLKNDQTIVINLTDFSIEVIIKKLFSEAQVTSNNDQLFCRGLKDEKDQDDFEQRTLYQLDLTDFLQNTNSIVQASNTELVNLPDSVAVDEAPKEVENNLSLLEVVDEASKKIINVNDKTKVQQKTFEEVFTIQISNYDKCLVNDKDKKAKHGWVILQSENKIFRMNISKFGQMFNDNTLNHDQGFGTQISFDPKDEYFVCGGKDSQNINVYSLKNFVLIQKIQTHVGQNVQCYFVDRNRAVSIGFGEKQSDFELICWDTSNMKNWTKIFSVEKDIKPITGYKGNLSALIINQFTCFWSEKLAHELSENIQLLCPIELEMEWISGPLSKFFMLMLESFNKSNQTVKSKLLPYMLQNVIHPYGYTFLSWLAYQDQGDLVQTAITCKDLKYVRDQYGNSPLLYALKRNSQSKVGWIVEYMCAYPKLVSEVTNFELCLLFKIGPSKLVSFIEGACIQIKDGLELVGLKKDENRQTYFEIDPMKVRYAEVNNNLLNPSVDESEKRSIEFKKTNIGLNMQVGSYESIAFQEALQECPDDKVFNTEFIQAVVFYKWRQVAPQVNFLLFMQITFTFCVTVHAYLQGTREMLHVLTAFTIYFAALEGLTFYLSEYNSKYNSPGNVLIIAFISVYLYHIYQRVDETVDAMLPLINLLCWLQMVIQLQTIEIIRTFVKVFSKTLQSLTGFIIFLIMNMIAFATTSNLLERKNERMKQFLGCDETTSICKNNVYQGKFEEEWYWKNNLNTSLDTDMQAISKNMFSTYLTITKGDFDGDDKSVAYIIFVILITVIANIILLNLIIAIMSDAYAEVMTSITEKGMQEQSAMILQQEKLMFWKRSTGSKKCLIWINYLDVLEGGWKSQVEAITSAVKNTFKTVLIEFEKTEKKLLKRLEDQIEKVSLGLNEKLDKQQKKMISQLDTHQQDMENLEANLKIKMDEYQAEVLDIVNKNMDEQKKNLDEINNHLNEKMEEQGNLTNLIKKSLTQKLIDENAEVKNYMNDGMSNQAKSLLSVKETLAQKLEKSISSVTLMKTDLKDKLETQKADINSHVASGIEKAKNGFSFMQNILGKKLEVQSDQAENVKKDLAKEIVETQEKVKSKFLGQIKKQIEDTKTQQKMKQEEFQREFQAFESFMKKTIDSEQNEAKDQLNQQLETQLNEVEKSLKQRIDSQQTELSLTKSSLFDEMTKQQSQVKEFLSDKIDSQLDSIKNDLNTQVGSHNAQLADIKTTLTSKIEQEQTELEVQIDTIKQQVTDMQSQQTLISNKVSKLLDAIKNIKK